MVVERFQRRTVPLRAVFFGMSVVAVTGVPIEAQSIERLSPELDKLIAVDARIEQLANGFQWSEGPVWRRDGGYLLFSDVPGNTIYKWKEGEGLSIFLRPSGYTGPTPPGREH